jgi:hypothetical protein
VFISVNQCLSNLIIDYFSVLSVPSVAFVIYDLLMAIFSVFSVCSVAISIEYFLRIGKAGPNYVGGPARFKKKVL